MVTFTILSNRNAQTARGQIRWEGGSAGVLSFEVEVPTHPGQSVRDIQTHALEQASRAAGAFIEAHGNPNVRRSKN